MLKAGSVFFVKNDFSVYGVIENVENDVFIIGWYFLKDGAKTNIKCSSYITRYHRNYVNEIIGKYWEIEEVHKDKICKKKK